MKKSIIRTLFVFGLILVLGLSASCKKDKTYSIEYELNGGVLTSAPTEYDGKSKVTLPTPTKEGETFAGWFDNAGFNGSAVYEIAKGSTGDKKFYAKWNTQGGGEGGGRKWELNRFGFDGGGMKYVIKVLPVSEFDPFSADYSGSKKALKQSHQRDVEEAYNIKIEKVYSDEGKSGKSIEGRPQFKQLLKEKEEKEEKRRNHGRIDQIYRPESR